tara:strand:+ start:95 stop:295 length:201 start_codon:yes stop_codon:yes gene_type:complete
LPQVLTHLLGRTRRALANIIEQSCRMHGLGTREPLFEQNERFLEDRVLNHTGSGSGDCPQEAEQGE